MKKCLVLLCCTVAGYCLASAAFAQDAFPPASQSAPDYADRILTPPAPHTPRINGPSIYGERPGRPFIYTIPATGDRPMTFSVKGLPAGLVCDSSNGRITGEVAESGSYTVVLHAKNELGENDKTFRIVIGDRIALTPPMGWNSWNSWAWTVDQNKVLLSARVLVQSGLAEHGWTYINIDDTWQGQPDPTTHALQGNENFPDMKGLCDTLHGMGLKAGIYSTPWMGSYSMFPGGSADNPQRIWVRPPPDRRFPDPNPNHVFGQYSFAAEDATQWAKWGFDYLKYDWNPNDVPHVVEMNDALKASGRDFVFSLSNSAPFEGAADWAKNANLWRTTGDITDNYESLCSNGFTQSQWVPYSGPGHWNDPDMLIVGWVGWGSSLHPTHLNADEQYTHISLWCLEAAPLLIGADLQRLDPFTISLLSNDEVLAIDQDPAGKEAVQVEATGGNVNLSGPRPYSHNGEMNTVSLPRLQVWSKPLADGSQAVGLFNLGDAPALVTADFSVLKIRGRQTVRDLWRQKDLGKYKGSFSATVNPHGVVLVKIAKG